MIHMTVKTVLENIRNMTETCSGSIKGLEVGIRIRKRQMETLVHIRVAKVWIHSP